MNWFDTVGAVIKLPFAYWHVLRMSHKITNNSSLVSQIRSLHCSEMKTPQRPSPTLVKSYFWASRLMGSGNCLPRSLALYEKLIAKDCPVEHKIGVCHADGKLYAHAWVEHCNKPLNESLQIKQKFTEMVKYEDQLFN